MNYVILALGCVMLYGIAYILLRDISLKLIFFVFYPIIVIERWWEKIAWRKMGLNVDNFPKRNRCAIIKMMDRK